MQYADAPFPLQLAPQRPRSCLAAYLGLPQLLRTLREVQDVVHNLKRQSQVLPVLVHGFLFDFGAPRKHGS